MKKNLLLSTICLFANVLVINSLIPNSLVTNLSASELLGSASALNHQSNDNIQGQMLQGDNAVTFVEPNDDDMQLPTEYTSLNDGELTFLGEEGKISKLELDEGYKLNCTKQSKLSLNGYSSIDIISGLLNISGEISFDNSSDTNMSININQDSKLVISKTSKIDDLFVNITVDGGILVFDDAGTINLSGILNLKNQSKLYIKDTVVNFKESSNLNLNNSLLYLKDSSLQSDTKCDFKNLENHIMLDNSNISFEEDSTLNIDASKIEAISQSTFSISENNQLTINNTSISFTTGSQFTAGENNTVSIINSLMTLDNSGLTTESSSKVLIKNDSTVNLINNGVISAESSEIELDDSELALSDGKVTLDNVSLILNENSKMNIEDTFTINLLGSCLQNKGTVRLSGINFTLNDCSQLHLAATNNDNGGKFIINDNGGISVLGASQVNLDATAKLYANKGSNICIASGNSLNINYGGLLVLHKAQITDNNDNGGNITIKNYSKGESVKTAIFLSNEGSESSESTNMTFIKCNTLDLGKNVQVLRSDDSNINIDVQNFVAGE